MSDTRYITVYTIHACVYLMVKCLLTVKKTLCIRKIPKSKSIITSIHFRVVQSLKRLYFPKKSQHMLMLSHTVKNNYIYVKFYLSANIKNSTEMPAELISLCPFLRLYHIQNMYALKNKSVTI
jgi:hypothetical protein